MTDERLRLLPVQVRPQAGEGIRAFIVRLASANHLPARYLRTYLCEPPRHLGLPSFGRLAVVTGRDAETLRITLETRRCLECGAAMPPLGILGRQALRCSQTCRQKAYRRRNPRAHWPNVPCKHCGMKMRVHPGQRHRLCSSACRRADYFRRKREHWIERGLGEPRSCPSCGDPIFSTTRVTCSNRCRQRMHRQPTGRPRPDTPSSPPLPSHLQALDFCMVCDAPLPPGVGLLRYPTCSDRCRQQIYRQRRAASMRSSEKPGTK